METVSSAGPVTQGTTERVAKSREPLLELQQIHRRFGGVHALRGVSLSLYPREVVALVGDNGAGKSTLVKIISGVVTSDSGTILHRGRPVTISNANDAASIGIRTVYQDLALCDNLDVVQNMFLGREIRLPWYLGRRLAAPVMEDSARRTLAELNVTTIRDLRTPCGMLSGGQRQCVAISRAVLSDPSIVILDEPTAALGVEQQHQVVELIKRLREQDRAVIVVSHDMEHVRDVADRVIVLRLGVVAAELARAEATHEAIVRAITGGRLVGEPRSQR